MRAIWMQVTHPEDLAVVGCETCPTRISFEFRFLDRSSSESIGKRVADLALKLAHKKAVSAKTELKSRM